MSRYTKRTKINIKFCFGIILDIFNLGDHHFRNKEGGASGLCVGIRCHRCPVGGPSRPLVATMKVMVMMMVMVMERREGMEWMDVMLSSVMNE